MCAIIIIRMTLIADYPSPRSVIRISVKGDQIDREGWSVYLKYTEVSFAEIPYSPAVGREDIPGVSEVGRTPAAVIRTSAMSIEISNQISESLLSRILREVSNA